VVGCGRRGNDHAIEVALVQHCLMRRTSRRDAEVLGGLL
jgi:hypothetical protein